jgi:hypothetical protein
MLIKNKSTIFDEKNLSVVTWSYYNGSNDSTYVSPVWE